MTSENIEIFGIRAIIEAISSEKSIDKIFLQKNSNSPLSRELKNLIKEKQLSFNVVPIEKLNKISKNNKHQGAVAFISPVIFHDLENLIVTNRNKDVIPLFIILDQISNVKNLGAIIRTAECTGVNGVIIPKTGNAPINGAMVKSSSGAAFNIPICKVNHIKDAAFLLQSENIQIVCATEKAETIAFDVDFTKPTAIIMGSEKRGIQPSILKMADVTAKLPMFGKIASLNVSVACGSFLYEAIRQRKVK